MRIAVIGYKGVVGNATYEVLKRLGEDVVGVEKDDKPIKADVYMICVPEDYVEQVFLDKVNVFKPTLTVIRSTVLPSTTKMMQRLYPEWHFMHFPEYLREATALHDSYFGKYMTFGVCCEKHTQLMDNIYKRLNIKIFHTDTTTSEVTKYTINNIKAVLISYWNSLYLLAEQFKGTQCEFDPHEVARIAVNDSVISNYGTILGMAYGGKCLPKDIGKYIAFCERMGFNPELHKATKAINDYMLEKYGLSTVKTGS